LRGPVEPAARGLLGCLVRAGGVTVRLTEVEAYLGTGEDAASHAHRGPTPRTAVMFGPAGVLYVYFTYGMHWCGNIVTGPEGLASAVLMRAGEVVGGRDRARERRGPAPADRDLARGPARLMSALGIDGTATGTPVLDGIGPLTLAPPPVPVDPGVIRAGPRIGISVAQEARLRFWLDGEPTVTRYRPHNPRRRVTGTPPHAGQRRER
jgi:DNA-3-methyladenine glycosylase